ncbi:MAG TPA: hypothetical protein PKM65_00870 [Spirochaetota bacterium]|nr:hypothetical protein [Spirochaetota bacterium]HNT11631.1 hypothetical protein [Spirochaetota bacterium]HNV47530.1 hypothetical protein [Spirochaetota bacterium]HPI23957.1 hypothetical protein [Spirochaetota bacterium]HPU88620.1 hypothetical protein [Spirochaetota bacterium]
MIDVLKKTVLTGIGLATLGAEKIEEYAKKIAEDSKLAESEGKKFVDELLRDSEIARKNLEAKINELITTALDRMDLTSKKEVEELKKKLADLEEQLRNRAG